MMFALLPHLRPILLGGSSEVFAPIPGLGNLAFYTDFTQGTLVPQVGPTWSITRATTSTTVDFEGLVRPILSGEARFRGLRRVENGVATTSEDFSNAAWTKISATITGGISDPLGGSNARTFTATAGSASVSQAAAGNAVTGATYRSTFYIKRRTGTGSVFLRAATGSDQDVTAAVTSSWRRVTVSGLAPDTTRRIMVKLATSGDEVDIFGAQSEDTSGQAITAPSEYVSRGVLSTPWHGAGVDGVKYFATANGNTVASNVVTEATGAALTLTGDVGIRPFGAATHIGIHNRDLTNAAWVKGATATVAKDQTGADGVANGASSFTGGAVGATNTVLQTVTLASSSRAFETYIQRLVGTGTVEMTTDNGTTWVDITSSITSGWTKVRIPAQTVTNPVFGFRITTLSDKIAVDYITNTSVVDAPVIGTTTAAVTVNADVVTADGAGVINATEGTLWVESVGPVSSAERVVFGADDGTSSKVFGLSQSLTARGGRGFIVNTGTQMSQAVGAYAAGATSKNALMYKLNDSNIAFDGTAGTDDVACTVPAATTFRLGYITSGSEADTTIRKAAYSIVRASNANAATATSP